MLSPELLDVQDYVIIDGDFAGVEINKGAGNTFDVTYTFDMYVNLYLSLIKQFDEIELRVMEPSSSKISYFSGDNLTPSKVSQAAVNFVPRVKSQLVNEKNKYQIASSVIKLSQFLDDDIVAAIGSGRINEENYELFLPEIEYSEAVQDPVGDVELLNLDSQELTKLAISSFVESSFHPSEIFELKKKNQRKVLSPSAEDFYNALKPASTRTKVSETQVAKQSYQRCRFYVTVRSITESKLIEISSKRTLELHAIFYRKRVPKLKSTFAFKNSTEYENCSLRLKNLTISVRPNSYERGVDFIRILNPNSFDVVYELRQNTFENTVFVVDVVGTGKIKAKSSVSVRAKFLFGGESDSRSYSVVAVRDLPIITNHSNVMDTASVSQSRIVRLPSLKLEAFVEDKAGIASIVTKNVPDFVEKVLISRHEKGFTIEKNIAISPPNSEYSDADILPDGDYVYRLKFFSGGCQVLETIQIPFIRTSVAPESASVSFDARVIAFGSSKINSRQSTITHTVEITENIQTTVAEGLQAEIQALGLSDKFDEDRENNKSQVSITTRYEITRLNLETGLSETIPTLFQPGSHTLAFVGDPTHGYRYSVKLKVVNTASLSFLTVIDETDVTSGNSYKLRFRKWRSYENRRTLSLPSLQQIVKNNLSAAIEVGGIGEIKTIEVPFSVNLPKIEDLTIEVDGINNKNYLTWSVTGDISEVDHFMILGTYANIERVLGTAMPAKFDIDSKYRYVDDQLQGLVGEVSYRLILVQRGLKFTTPTSPVSYTKGSSTPLSTLLLENQ